MMSVVYFVVQQMMLFSIPLLIVALGAMYSERSGIINIAMEGNKLMGVAGTLFLKFTDGTMSGQLQLILAILISAVVGIVFSLLHAYASINMKADQTISVQHLICLHRLLQYLQPELYSRNMYSRYSLLIHLELSYSW